ncbi:MAG: methyltransferase domain-containing protein [Thermoanaerobaculia bacterium]
MSFLTGRCNICGCATAFYFTDRALYRESLKCRECLSTSRYRSIARGLLRAVGFLTGVETKSLAELSGFPSAARLKIYDTQIPFYYERDAYPTPDVLSRCPWIDVQTSVFRPREPLGKQLGPNRTNQNLENLTFPSDSFDIVVTSDVMEHVRLDDLAHREIQRVLKPGGFYLFTVPHFRSRDTLVRVRVRDADDPSKDEYLTEREYHGNANSEDGRALSFRAYGTDLDARLQHLGFQVEYTKQDFPETGILNTELFFCRLSKRPAENEPAVHPQAVHAVSQGSSSST